MADHGDQFAMAARLRSQDAEAVIGVVEGHSLDQPGEHSAIRECHCQGFRSFLRATVVCGMGCVDPR
jgi:hypothetical protein